MELQESIDFNVSTVQSDELPKMLSSLYVWSIQELLKDSDPMGVVAVISELREGYASLNV